MIGIAAKTLVAFNLICSGTQTTGPLTLSIPKDGQPFSIVYRVDLARMRYCSGECKTTFPIKRASATEIVFNSTGMNEVGFGGTTSVNRESGSYNDVTVFEGKPYTRILRMGSCDKMPFTGFPKRKF